MTTHADSHDHLSMLRAERHAGEPMVPRYVTLYEDGPWQIVDLDGQHATRRVQNGQVATYIARELNIIERVLVDSARRASQPAYDPWEDETEAGRLKRREEASR